MKLERINDNQIRCTLSREDLESRGIKLSELAYGSPKAKALFNELMSFASYKLGFEAEDIPIMVEAIPMSRDCLVLVVTKVEYPEELDTRFSQFASYEDADFAAGGARAASDMDPMPAIPLTPAADAPMRAFAFADIDELIRLASLMHTRSKLATCLYYDSRSREYLLIVGQGELDQPGFARAAALISEYGRERALTENMLTYLNEHYELVLRSDVFGKLYQLHR